MKPKLLLCLALVLSSVCTAFALAYAIQLKPAEMSQHPDILIRSALTAGDRNYLVVLLPRTNFPISRLQGRLEVKDADKHLASCCVVGITLSDALGSGFDAYGYEFYKVMTNRFSRPLNGARVFTFEVATNLLVSSKFAVGDNNESTASRWFYLKDFSNEK
jgi:hypothetical protein